MAISVDLSKPLISKLIVNGCTQLVEYESLPVICFQCGRYGHVQEGCPDLRNAQDLSVVEPILPVEAPSPAAAPSDSVSFGPWMVAARRTRKLPPNQSSSKVPHVTSFGQASRFSPIFVSDSDGINVSHSAPTVPTHVPSIPGAKQKSAMAKKKSAISGRNFKATTVRKPLMMNLSDFPAFSRFSHKASTSKTSASLDQRSTLDKSKHSATVMQENENPNIVAGSFFPPDVNADSYNVPPLGDPPDPSFWLDTDARDQLPPAPLSHGSVDAGIVKVLDSGDSREVAMIEE
ncbi:hypothetical protein V6N13_137897 [Hibiscus sabdariffa]